MSRWVFVLILGLCGRADASVCWLELYPVSGAVSRDGVEWERGNLFDIQDYRGPLWYRFDAEPFGQTLHSLAWIPPGQDGAQLYWVGDDGGERSFWHEAGDVGFVGSARIVPEPSGWMLAFIALVMAILWEFWNVSREKRTGNDVALDEGGGDASAAGPVCGPLSVGTDRVAGGPD